MTQRTLLGRLLSPAGFAFALLCFLMPFVAVSCGSPDNQVTATFTGVDLAVGSAPELTGTGLSADDVATLHALLADEYDLEPLAFVAALFLMAGMASALIPRISARLLAGAVLAAAAGVLLILAELRAMSRLEDFRGSRLFGADAIPEPGVAATRFGFWLTAAVLIGLVAGQVVALRRTPKADATQASADSSPLEASLPETVPPETVPPETVPPEASPPEAWSREASLGAPLAQDDIGIFGDRDR